MNYLCRFFIVHPVKAVTESVATNNMAITFFAFIVSILFKIGIVSLVYYRAFQTCWQAFSKLCKLSSISRKTQGFSYAICHINFRCYVLHEFRWWQPKSAPYASAKPAPPPHQAHPASLPRCHFLNQM